MGKKIMQILVPKVIIFFFFAKIKKCYLDNIYPPKVKSKTSIHMHHHPLFLFDILLFHKFVFFLIFQWHYSFCVCTSKANFIILWLSFIFHIIDSVFVSALRKWKLEIIKKTKLLHDIVHGEYYQQMLQSDKFLKSPFNIAFTINTDGV